MKKTAKKKLTGNKVAKKGKVARKPQGRKKTGKAPIAPKKQVRKRNQKIRRTYSPEIAVVPSGRQSGDLQGLSRVEGADSQSVDELLEEGNAFEAAAVQGVEDAEEADESEVHTHEVLEDDVPGEYLDKD